MTSRWQLSTVVGAVEQTATARSLRLALSEPVYAQPGSHIDIRLTAEDGYSTARTYSISDARESTTLEVTIERADDGEVSPYLVDVIEIGEPLEISGPHGRWFTWDHRDERPVQLIAGGSGIVPLMSMIRDREIAAPQTAFNLVYSVRSAQRCCFADELAQLAHHHRLPISIVHTRSAPPGSPRPAGRITQSELAAAVIPAELAPLVYICGPNSFVEPCARWMQDAGHSAHDIRTERFG